MPWQILAAHVVGAVNDDGRPRWPFIIVTVPRQSGKTTAAGAWAIERAFTVPNARVWYTAQTGQKAREKWLEVVNDFNRSPFAPMVKVLKTNGSESMEFARFNSAFRPHPPTEDSLHSMQSDLNLIDEAWAFDEPQADALMQAITPTQATRPHRQTIILSTVGTAASTWLHGLIDQGLAGAEDIFLLDYGIANDQDATDLDAVAASHPAFGYTLDMDSLKAGLRQLGPAGFARGYGNRRTGAREMLIHNSTWKACQTTDYMPANAPAVIGAAIDIERTETAIAAACWVGDIPMIEVIEVRPGTRWAPAKIEKYCKDLKDAPIVDNVGPSSTLHAELTRRGLPPMDIKTRELTTASAELLDRMTKTDADGNPAPAVRIRSSSHLDLAMAIVEKRRLGDGWTWQRRSQGGSIAALEAATLALHGLQNRQPADPKPQIF